MKKESNTPKVTLSSPWQIYYRQLNALFGVDPEVRVLFDADETTIKLYVENSVKADAIQQLLPETKTFGNVEIKIMVIPADKNDGMEEFYDDDIYTIYDKAFGGSPCFVYSETIDVVTNTMTFVVFAKEVVQYYSDNAGDIHGLTSTLYENLAREILGGKGVYYCTDNERACF